MPSDSPARTPVDAATAERVSHGVIRVMKLTHAVRQHAPRIHPGVDTAAYPVLFHLSAEPRRVSNLADCVHSDVSTVSRQVSSLETHALVEKVADPMDRRAQVVRLTDEGRELLEEISTRRTAWIASLLAGWTPEEAADFATHLERFADTLQIQREVATGRPRAETTTNQADHSNQAEQAAQADQTATSGK